MMNTRSPNPYGCTMTQNEKMKIKNKGMKMKEESNGQQTLEDFARRMRESKTAADLAELSASNNEKEFSYTGEYLWLFPVPGTSFICRPLAYQIRDGRNGQKKEYFVRVNMNEAHNVFVRGAGEPDESLGREIVANDSGKRFYVPQTNDIIIVPEVWAIRELKENLKRVTGLKYIGRRSKGGSGSVWDVAVMYPAISPPAADKKPRE